MIKALDLVARYGHTKPAVLWCTTIIVQGDATAVNSGRYVKESYSQGDACDLTGQTRQTEVTHL